MKPWHKILIILLSVLILAIGVLALLLKSRLLPEAIEDMVVSRVEVLIKQPISYSRLEVGLWGTITIQDISVGDTILNENTPLFYCSKLMFNCRILPLLSKKVVIEKVILHRPQINLKSDELGNVGSLSDRSPEERAVVPEQDNTDLPAVSFSVNQLAVEDGKLTMHGNSESSPQPLTTVLHQLDLTVFDFSLVSPFSLNLTTQIDSTPPSRATLEAVVDPSDKRVTSNLEIQTDSTPQCRAQLDSVIAVKDYVLMIEQLKVISGDSTISMKGNFQHFFSGPLAGQLHVTSPALVIDEIISCVNAMENGDEMDQDEDPAEERDEGNGVLQSFFLEGADIDTDLVIDRISYGNVDISDVKVTCGIHDNTVDLQLVQGALGDGLLKGKGRSASGVDGFDYSVHLTGNNVQLNTIVAAVSPGVKGDFRGFTDFTVDLNGSGTTQESFKKHLKGEGEIQIRNGTVSGLEFLQSLASFIKVDKLDTLTFDHSHGTFRVADGLIHTTNNLMGKEMELYPEGTISLDAYLNLALKMRISPALSEQIVDGVLTKYFIDEKGWTVLELALKGPSDEVVVMPASSTIKSISEMFVDILLKKEESDSAEREDKKEALEELLEKLMKRSEEGAPSQEENPPAAQ